jgi:hypothetical protein
LVEDGVKGRGNLAPFSGRPRPRPCPDPHFEQVNLLRREGLTVREIAQRLNLRPSEVKRLLGSEVEEIEIQVEGFEGLDFTTSQESRDSSLVLDITIDVDLDDLTSSSDWDLSDLFNIRHDFNTDHEDVSLDTQRGYLDLLQKSRFVKRGIINLSSVGDLDVIRCYFETQGYEQVLVTKGRKTLKVLRDLIKGYGILHTDFSYISPHGGYSEVLYLEGYDEIDLSAEVFILKYSCSNCGFEVYKPHGVRSVFGGRVHPVLLSSRRKRTAIRSYNRNLAVVHGLVKEGVFNWREGRFVRVSDKSLSLLNLEFTVPVGVSKSLRDYVVLRLREAKEKFGFDLIGHVRDAQVLNAIYTFVFGDIVKAFRKAVISALRDTIREILAKEEGLKVKGKIQLGGKYAVHIWSSSWLTPHFHVHVDLFNVVRTSKGFIRFKPELSKWALDLLRIKWRNYLKKYLFEIEGLKAWLYEEDFEDEFVVHNHFIELDLRENGDFANAGKLLHRLKYVCRSPLLDLNTAFWDKRVVLEDGRVVAKTDDGDVVLDLEWIECLCAYQTRYESFGFVHSAKRLFNVDIKDLRKTEMCEYCPVCGHPLVFVERITLPEFLKQNDRFVMVFYHNGCWRYEFWKKKGRGGGLNGGEGR